MKKDKILFDKERGPLNQRSYQTKSRKSTNLTKKEDVNNRICKICETFLKYFAVNGYKLNHKRQIVNFIHQQAQNGLNVVSIPVSFFKYDKQLRIWILQTSAEILDLHLRPVLEELSEKRLSDYKIKVLKNK